MFVRDFEDILQKTIVKGDEHSVGNQARSNLVLLLDELPEHLTAV